MGLRRITQAHKSRTIIDFQVTSFPCLFVCFSMDVFIIKKQALLRLNVGVGLSIEWTSIFETHKEQWSSTNDTH